LAGIFYYVADSVAPYPESHTEGRRESIRATNDIGTHVENVLTTVIETVAPDLTTSSVGFSSNVVRGLFPSTGNNDINNDNHGSGKEDDAMRRQIYDAVVDTRTYEIEYCQGTGWEAQQFIDKFYKLLSKVSDKWTDHDWVEFQCMLDLDDNLLWRRCILHQNGVPQKSKQAKIHAAFEETFTTLHCAAAMGNLRLCEEILKRAPATVDAVDKFGRQPLHIAAYWGHLEIVELLTKCLTMLNDVKPVGCHAPVDVSGWTPAIYAKMAEKNSLNKYERGLMVATDKTIGQLKKEVRATEIEKVNSEKKLRNVTPKLSQYERKIKLKPLVDKIKSLEATTKGKTFKRCREILYAHGDRHVSPKQNNGSNSPNLYYHVERVGDTPNRTRGSRGSTPLRMEVNGGSGDGVRSSDGVRNSDGVRSSDGVQKDHTTKNESMLNHAEMIALSNGSKLVYGVAAQHMTGFRSTQEDAVIVHFDTQQLWVS
jgi:hypothetical protein